MNQKQDCIIRGTPPTLDKLAAILTRLLEDQRGTKITHTLEKEGDKKDKTA
ncbi:hypothetical protein [Hespellia stercorisuis]|uniref:Uncharacterized protein n=1 Tax=Hespellia stercorisuis DSM 15480 TaxID=1121950 RepID=A0A1M6TSY0_9FIRM|nr:hypothetical protein [Hespellia stercorisuis]SHK60010.1 hypothetical protein SAMN02745243_03320 [Hespellia stercorisuis DSM 15480]